MPRIRVGVALLIPSPLREEVNGLRRALGDGALDRIEPHVTLVPPVNIREDELDAAVGILRRAASDTEPLTLNVGPISTFEPDNPVIYCAVNEHEALNALRNKIFTPPLERTLTFPFYPHLTLCDDAPSDRISAAMVALADFSGYCTIDSVHLLREGEHRRWEPLAEARFKGSRTAGRGGLETVLEVSSIVPPDAQRFGESSWKVYDDAHGLVIGRREPFCIIARQQDEVVGMAEGAVTGDTLHLSELIVDENIRGQGVGRQVIKRMVELGTEQGCGRVTVRVLSDGPISFYESQGFKLLYDLPDWRFKRDFVQMERQL